MTGERALVTPDVLAWAREQTGLDLEAAARKIGTRPSRLEAWESGALLPSVNQARAAARVYHRPLAVFYQSRRPEPDHLPHDFRRTFLEEVPAQTAELRYEVRRARLRRKVASQLGHDTAPPTPWLGAARTDVSGVDLGIAIRALTGVSLEDQTEFASRAQGRERDVLNYWRGTIEGLGALVFHFSRVDVDEARGFSLAETPYPVIALNGADSPNGRIFTLFHELAHLYLGREGACNLREVGMSPDARTEALCNAAAGEALVPSDGLLREDILELHGDRTEWDDWELTRLSRRYGISREVVLRRLLTIGRTTHEFYELRREEWAALPRRRTGGWVSPARLAVRDSGQRFTRIVLDAYGTGAVTASDLAEYLGVRLKHLPAIAELIEGRALLTGRER